jgi:hypothetical protein
LIRLRLGGIAFGTGSLAELTEAKLFGPSILGCPGDFIAGICSGDCSPETE